MTEQTKKYLSDIYLSIKKIEAFTEGVNSFDAYSGDFKTQSAVERQLGIIGEAINKIRKLDEVHLIHDHRIVGLRNRLIHAYDSIDNTIVWTIIRKHIPLLKDEILKFSP
ncbi:HepT-like ribonuclease domain-containing protein [Reichenbachiella agariperforans]|uniref:HepT-like ribonuclease domain-containing protein n=1 Tax=Reichenbachiella agariperforans TaxID=156994 RepID=UPI001C085EEB|nr:HepT-like ribonuclease domain-containing protein [Reichenbachiella agariperforans]MBU2912690.1 DUF86 domain-containing protein [Reichenbachiella agariperforans]